MSAAIEHVAEIVSRLKDLTAGSGDDEHNVRLLAHIFAACCWLERGYSPRMGETSPQVCRGPEDARAILGRAPTASNDVDEVYRLLVTVLLGLESWLGRLDDGRLADLPPHIPLTGFGGALALPAGEVRWWRRPRSPWLAAASQWRAKADEARKSGAVSSMPPREPWLAIARLRDIGMHWQQHGGPEVEVINLTERRLGVRRSEALALSRAHRVQPDSSRASGRAAGSFRVALAPLGGSLGHPIFKVSDDGREFIAPSPDSFFDPETLSSYLERLWGALNETEPISVLALPELMVPAQALSTLERLQRGRGAPALVFAGSFHCPEIADAPQMSGHGRPVNAGPVLDRQGRWWSHNKCGLYCCPAGHVKQAPGWFVAPIPRLDTAIEEGILRPRRLTVLETAAGRVTSIICADALSQSPANHVNTLLELQPDLLFVLAMSRETSEFTEFFRRMARARINTFFVNASFGGDGEAGTLRASMELHFNHSPGAPAIRVRWLQAGDIERFDFEQKRWVGASGGDGIEIIRVNGEAAAFVVDLRQHWNWG